MHFQMNPSVISMNRERDFHPGSSSFEDPNQNERYGKPLAGYAAGSGLPFRLEEIRQMSLSLCHEQKWEAALPWLEAAFFHFPECPDITFHLSLTQARLGLTNESRATAKTLEDAGPNCIKTRLRLCWLNLETLDWKTSHSHLKTALQKGASRLIVSILQWMAYIRSNQLDEALMLCEETEDHPDYWKKLLQKMSRILSTGRHEEAASFLLQIFTAELESNGLLDPQAHPAFKRAASFDKVEFPNPSTKDAVPEDPAQLKKLTRLRMESDFRKQFWNRERMIHRDEQEPMLLQELPPTSHPASTVSIIQMPTPLKPQLPSSQLIGPTSSTAHTEQPDRIPFQPYNWLAIRQPWQDEAPRLERFTTAAMRFQEDQSSFWTLTTSHPERIVGLGSLTSGPNHEGLISVRVTPLIAHHRQETNLFITLMQKAKQLGLTRLTANVERESLEDMVIRRNGFRIAHEEEILEIPLTLWIQKVDPVSCETSFLPHWTVRDFHQEDWNQVRELIQSPASPADTATIRWRFPSETSMLPTTLNKKLSTVLEYQGSMIGVLLAKHVSSKELHLLLHADGPRTFPAEAHSAIKPLMGRFVPLAAGLGYESVKFKRRDQQGHTPCAEANKWTHNDYVVGRNRILQREEINP